MGMRSDCKDLSTLLGGPSSPLRTQLPLFFTPHSLPPHHATLLLLLLLSFIILIYYTFFSLVLNLQPLHNAHFKFVWTAFSHWRTSLSLLFLFGPLWKVAILDPFSSLTFQNTKNSISDGQFTRANNVVVGVFQFPPSPSIQLSTRIFIYLFIYFLLQSGKLIDDCVANQRPILDKALVTFIHLFIDNWSDIDCLFSSSFFLFVCWCENSGAIWA